MENQKTKDRSKQEDADVRKKLDSLLYANERQQFALEGLYNFSTHLLETIGDKFEGFPDLLRNCVEGLTTINDEWEKALAGLNTPISCSSQAQAEPQQIMNNQTRSGDVNTGVGTCR